MVPNQLKNFVDSGVQCIIVQRRAPPPKKNKKIKSKMTRECDLGQVDFREDAIDNTENLLEEKQFPRIPHIVLGEGVDTRSGRRG